MRTVVTIFTFGLAYGLILSPERLAKVETGRGDSQAKMNKCIGMQALGSRFGQYTSSFVHDKPEGKSEVIAWISQGRTAAPYVFWCGDTAKDKDGNIWYRLQNDDFDGWGITQEWEKY